MSAPTKAGSYWKTPTARVPSQDTAPMRRPQSMTLASVIRVVTPRPDRVSVFPWSRTCTASLGSGPRDTLDRADLAGGYRAEDGIAQVQSQGNSQECVERRWFAGLKTPQRAETDPGISCEHGLRHVAGQSQLSHAGSDLGFHLSGCFHVSLKQQYLASYNTKQRILGRIWPIMMVLSSGNKRPLKTLMSLKGPQVAY